LSFGYFEKNGNFLEKKDHFLAIFEKKWQFSGNFWTFNWKFSGGLAW